MGRRTEVAGLLGQCLWCGRPLGWDRDAGWWRHTESGSLCCPDGALAAIDNAASRAGLDRLTRAMDAADRIG
jgi:hypothetical protein